jgi:hypothetical protein
MTVTIAAFGALNNESYDSFVRSVTHWGETKGVSASIISAAPYPNARAESEPGRPLRAEALQDEAKKNQLYQAVAADAKKVGATRADFAVMPCMSMIGFHDGIERALGRPIVKLSEALAAKYKDVDRLGVLHMRPAKKRIEEIFGARAVTPDEDQAKRLQEAEDDAKRLQDLSPLYSTMKEIVESWRDRGITHVLFARADAPKAHLAAPGLVEGIVPNSYFDILAEAVIMRAIEKQAVKAKGAEQG